VALNKAIQPILIALFQAMLLSAGCGNQPADSSPPAAKNESSQDPDWGCEINVDEMITMAKKGRIVEIQWHVMPNVLRAQASDGNIYHLRNENKGVDLRNTLINAGVKIGKGGVLFRHVF